MYLKCLPSIVLVALAASLSNPIGVRAADDITITSPTEGQLVAPTGNKITVSGKYNASNIQAAYSVSVTVHELDIDGNIIPGTAVTKGLNPAPAGNNLPYNVTFVGLGVNKLYRAFARLKQNDVVVKQVSVDFAVILD